jgi:plastocyanin
MKFWLEFAISVDLSTQNGFGNAGLLYTLAGTSYLQSKDDCACNAYCYLPPIGRWTFSGGGHVARMNCLAHSVLVGVLISFSTHDVWADAIVEGIVQLPKVTPKVPNTARYQNTIQGEVAAPDTPVAVVYLEGNFPINPATNGPSVQMQQKHYQFAPGILPIQKGTSVDFPNLDDAYHNVFSYSKAKRFDLGRYRKDEKPAAILFDKAGVIKLYCEIHEHMRGTILVLDTPYFVKTDATGKYRLAHLPTGNYTLKAWLDEKTIYNRAVALKNEETLKVDFEQK